MEAKGNIRKEVFARRRAATQEEIQEKSRMIYEKITALPEFLDADCFFAYMDFKKEVMTRDLIEKALQMGKTVAVPRVEDDDMVYYEIKDFSTLKSGYFGIMEPDGGKENVWQATPRYYKYHREWQTAGYCAIHR